MPYNFLIDSVHTRNFVADFLQVRCNILHGKRLFCVLNPPFGELGATYDVYLKLIGKCVVKF